MRASLTTVCTPGFLDAFAHDKPTGDVTDFTERDATWQRLLDFLRWHTHVEIDTSESLEHLIQRQPLVRALLTRDPACGFTVGYPAGREETPARTELLLTDDSRAAEKSLCAGRLAATPEQAYTVWQQAGQRRSTEVRRGGEVAAWSDLVEPVATQSIVIVDRFLATEAAQVEENVLPLVEALVPEHAAHRLHVLLVMAAMPDGKKRSVPAAQMHDSVVAHLKSVRPHVEAHVCVVQSVAGAIREEHDRHVYTDYVDYFSGHSLSYFKRGACAVKTTLEKKPFTDQALRQDAEARLRDIGRLVRDAPDHMLGVQYIAGQRPPWCKNV